MNRYLLFFIFLGAAFLSEAQKKTLSPAEFLGYEIGERFTRHHAVMDYYKYIAENNSNVKLIPYGETYEFRPLILAVISSPENIEKLEEIRKNNLMRTRLVPGVPSDNRISIVWLSYNIHGNEASSVEASMLTIFDLIDPEKPETKKWLENTVVIIDPCVNPDGRDRYANFYNQYGNRNFNPNGDAIEHHEPWPGGRPNHYLFDLNRDWAWQTQIESRKRSEIYHQWMPHVHVDFHEQGYNSPYYFAPAAEPFHEVITSWQREFQTMIGKNNAKYFDQEGWLYFTKQHFDLLYPSYGDTYPTYNGAIGMTYEQAGHGFAGLGIITEYGDTLTLRDRVLHHHTTGISTIEITSLNAEKVVKEFEKYFDLSQDLYSSTYKSYIISGENEWDKINSLLKFLDQQKIRYGLAPVESKSLMVYNYHTKSDENYSLAKGDIVVPVNQPLGRLVSVLFEPETKLSDTLTYDITAWSLPFVYGVEVYASTQKIEPVGEVEKLTISESPAQEKPYAYISKYNSFKDAKFLSQLLQNNINVRVTKKPLNIEGKTFNRGSIIITRRNNEYVVGGLDRKIKELAGKYDRHVYAISTGMAESGNDLGSGDISRIMKPNVALLGGEQTSSLAFGAMWHYFERSLEYPITIIGSEYINGITLSDYDVFIVPHGYYSIFDEKMLEKIHLWVMNGGKLILQGNSLSSFADSKGFALKKYDNEDQKKKFEEQKANTKVKERLNSYETQERDELNRSIFGAIYKVIMDNTHPLAYGYKKTYYSLKTSESRYAFLSPSGNVATLLEDPYPVSGYAGIQANTTLSNSLVFGVENIGQGNVVYLVDDPLFRAFWENGKLLFANAVFMVGH